MDNEVKTDAEVIYEINGKNLKRLRNVKGKKQEDIARDLGISTSIISRIENGKMGLSVKHITKLCQIYNLKPSYFYYTDDEDDEESDGQIVESAKTLMRNTIKNVQDKETAANMLKELQTFIGYLNAKYMEVDSDEES